MVIYLSKFCPVVVNTWLWLQKKKNLQNSKLLENTCVFWRSILVISAQERRSLETLFAYENMFHCLIVKFSFWGLKLMEQYRIFLQMVLWSRAFLPHFFYFAATATFFDQNWCFLILWPTNCSNVMFMMFHKFWCIFGFMRSESPPSRNQLFQRPV